MMTKQFCAVVAAIAILPLVLCADYTDYYLIGSDSGSNCPLDGNGSPKGWALSADGTTQESKGATDPDGIYHVNGKDGGKVVNNPQPGVIRGALSSTSANYSFVGRQLVFDGFCPAVQIRQDTGKTVTFNDVLVVSGANGEFRCGRGDTTPILAGASWVVEEGAKLGISACETARGLTCNATITGSGTLAAVGGLDEYRGYEAHGNGKGKVRTVTFGGDLSAFAGVFSAGERSNGDLAYNTYTHADCVNGLKCVIAAQSAFPQVTPDGGLLERAVIVTNGATLSFSCDATSSAMRGWDFGDGAVSTVEVAAGKTVLINGPVKGSKGFKKTGDGTLILNVGGSGAYDTITLVGASTVSAATLSAYVEACDQWIYDTFLAGLNALSPEAVATTCNSLTLSARINCLGGKTATVKFAYGISPDALTGTNAASSSATAAAPTVQTTITRLSPGVAYYVKAIAETDGEEPETCESGVACIQTAPSPDRPAGYMFLDYIYASGTQYINTGLLPKNALRVVETFSTTDSTVDKMLFGVRNAGYNFVCWTGNNPATSITPNLGTSGGVGASQTGKIAGQKWTIDFGIDGIYADGTELFSPSAYASYRTDAVSTQPLILFGLSTGGSIDNRKFIGNCYDFRAYENGVPVRNLIPARRDHDGTVGMYDLCGQVFYENLGTGVFTAGPERQPVFTIVENISGGALASVSLSFASADSSRTLKVAIGPAHGGDDPAGWAATETIATIASGATGATWTPPADWGSDQKLVARFYFTDTPAVWSDSIFWHDYAAPSLANVTADGSGGDTILVSGNLSSFSGPSCVLTVLTGDTAANATNVWASATRTAPGAFSLTLHEPDTSAARYIAPGSTVYAVVVAVANGQTTRSAPLPVIMKAAPTFAAAPTASVSRRTVTFSGTFKDAGMRGLATVTLYTGAATDGENNLVATEEPVTVSSGGSFSFVHTFPDFETSYKWQIRAVSTSAGAAVTRETRSAVANVTTLDSATYTWTGRGGDNAWENAANWSDNRDGDCLGYPQSASTYAVFPDLGHPYAVEVSANLAIRKITLNSPEVTLCGVGATRPKITLSENTTFTKMTLDHLEILRVADHTFAAGTTIHLKNAAKATINNCKLNAAGGTSLIKLEGGSTFQAHGLWIGGGNEIVIDDSEFVSTAAYSLGDTSTGGRIVFKGAAPKMTLNGTAFCGANMNASDFSLEFHLPAGGYAAAPITTTGNYYFFGAPNGTKTGNVTLDVVSAEGDGTGEYTCTLIVWQKGFDTNGHLILGSLPSNAASASFAFADELAEQTWADGSAVPSSAKSLGVHIVAPQTATPSWADYTAPDGSWSAVADGNGNVVFTFTDTDNAVLRHWNDGAGRFLSTLHTITLPIDEATGVLPIIYNIWHVAADGDDANGGTSPADAKATLAAAYTLLSRPYDKLLVHDGIYTNTANFVVTNGWRIVSEHGAAATRFVVTNEFTSYTIGNGNVKIEGNSGEVRGFTFAPADGIRQAHQVANVNYYGLLADCVVTNIGTIASNVAIRQKDLTSVISNCTFVGCQGTGATGSVIQQWTAGMVFDCKFIDCAGTSDRYGGAVTVGNAGSIVRNCLFVNCTNTGTAGAISFYGAGLVENCTIIGCTSTTSATGGGGVGVFGTPGTIRNCIVYGCRNKGGDANISSGVTVEYTATSPLLEGEGNIALAAMPDFADPEGGDYRVLSGATIDAGLNQSWMADAPDLAGTNRIIGATVDLGCYECAPQGLRAAIQPLESVGLGAGSEITLSAIVSAADTNGLTYAWTVTDKSGATVFTASGADCGSITHAYPIGLYTVSLTVGNGAHESFTAMAEDIFAVKPEVIWVNNAATETYPYDTKATGFTNFVDAVDFAESGMTVILADGVQTNTATEVVITKAMEIRGEGGAGSAAYYTTKNLTLNFSGSVVRGLTLLSNYKTDCYVSVQIGTLDSCVVTNYSRGYCTLGASSGGLVTNCTVIGCRNSGRDRFVSIGGGTIVNSRIIRNKTTNGSYNALLRLSGGLARGCLIADNESMAGNDGGNNAFAVEGSGTIESCTIVNNADACSKKMPAIGSGITVVNCIVVGNTNLDGPSGANGAASVTYTLCDVAGLTGAGCKTGDPLFKKAANGGYRLTGASPACNAGVNQSWMVDALDLDGNPRIIGKKVDMGCFECTTSAATMLFMR